MYNYLPAGIKGRIATKHEQGIAWQSLPQNMSNASTTRSHCFLPTTLHQYQLIISKWQFLIIIISETIDSYEMFRCGNDVYQQLSRHNAVITVYSFMLPPHLPVVKIHYTAHEKNTMGENIEVVWKGKAASFFSLSSFLCFACSLLPGLQQYTITISVAKHKQLRSAGVKDLTNIMTVLVGEECCFTFANHILSP